MVAELLSLLASSMAVIGRQRLYVYLASQAAMPASPIATSTSPNIRAFWVIVLCCWSATSSAISWKCSTGVPVDVAS